MNHIYPMKRQVNIGRPSGILGLILLFLTATGILTQAATIISYQAGTNGVPASAPDPASVAGGSWTKVDTTGGSINYLSVGLSPDPLYTNMNTWRFLDGATTGSQSLYYRKPPTAQQVTNAMWAGWKASWYLRVRDQSLGFLGSQTMFFQFGSPNALMNKRYICYADIDADGALYANNAGGPSRTVTADLTNALAYHLYEMIYDSATRTVDLWVDGALLMTNLPSFSAAIDGAAFGNGSPGGFGDGYYNFVKVEVNDLTPLTVTLSPTNATKDVGESHTFAVAFTGSATNLQWYKGGVAIIGAKQRSLTLASIVPGDAGNYKLGINDPQTGTEVFTTEATLTVNTDTTPPTVASVKSVPTLEPVRVRYSEAVDATSAQTAANYRFANDALAVSNAYLLDLRTVELRTAPQIAGSSYSLIVTGVQDLTFNPMLDSTNTFTVAAKSPVFYRAGTAGNPAQAPSPAATNGGGWSYVQVGTSPLVYATTVSPDGVTGLNAWNITDNNNTTTASYSINYRCFFPQPTRDFSRANGWCYHMKSRFVPGFPGAKAIYFAYGDVSDKRWLLWYNLTGADYDLATYWDADNVNNFLTTGGIGASDYHTHDLVYDPDTQNVNYYFDGSLIYLNWTGSYYSTSAMNGPDFGAANQLGKGSMNYNTVEFRVNADPGTLTITSHPTSATVARLAPLVLSGSASGFVGGYQWYKDGVALAGATRRTYIIYQVTTNYVGTYTLRAYNSEAEVESNPATLALLAPTVTIAPANATNLLVTFTGVLQSATNVTGAFTDVTPAPSSPLTLTNPASPAMFYRSRN